MPAGGRRSSCPAALELLDRLGPLLPRARPGSSTSGPGRARSGWAPRSAGRRPASTASMPRPRWPPRPRRNGIGASGRRARHRFEVTVAPADDLPFADGTFDAAMSSFVLQLVPNRAPRAARDPPHSPPERAAGDRHVAARHDHLARPTRSSTRSSTNSAWIRPDDDEDDAGRRPSRPGRPGIGQGAGRRAPPRRLPGGRRRGRHARDPLRRRWLHRLPDRIRRPDPVRQPRAGRARPRARDAPRATDGARPSRALDAGPDRLRHRPSLGLTFRQEFEQYRATRPIGSGCSSGRRAWSERDASGDAAIELDARDKTGRNVRRHIGVA